MELQADSWDLPKATRYFSEDSSYMIKVVPRHTPEKDYRWKYAAAKRKKKFSPQDTTIISCHAILYNVKGEEDTVEIWNKKLLNLFAPVTVLVSNNGDRVITLDDWSSLGYGYNVFAIYNELGELVKRYQLDDFSIFPLNNYEFSISSIWWRSGQKLLNDRRQLKLYMRTENGQNGSVLYDLDAYQFKKNSQD